MPTVFTEENEKTIRITPPVKQWLIENGHCEGGGSDQYYRFTLCNMLASGELEPEKLMEISEGKAMSVAAEKLFSRRSDSGDTFRVKPPSEMYSEKRYSATHAKTGQPVVDPIYERECTSMSEASKARAGVLFKHLGNKSGIVHNPLTEHEKSMLNELCTEHAWCGKVSGEFYESIGGHQNIKALIDDASSGGIEIAPIEFDADVVTFPLLHGELMPQVDLRPIPRGRRIEGASISTPTMAWGGGDDTTISLFTTTSMVNAIDTTIFAIDGAVRIGRDFLSDSPVNVGSQLTALVGERLMEELDTVIGNGNGSTQPEGIFQKSGVGTVNTDNGNTGPPTLDDYITLLFSIGKQYRKQNLNVAFVSNDTTYQRSRQIKIDPQASTTDQRPALAPLTTINDYETLGWRHLVQNDLANTVGGVCALRKYRLYRRLGLDMRFVEGGDTLARKNEMLLVYRARYGGKLMDASAMAKWTDGQS